MKGKIKLHGIIGIALFCLAVVMLREGREPFTTYFYSFAWWSYILAADALVYWLEGRSLIVSRTRTFLRMIPLSIFIWCIFEGFNFRLANWHYINLPRAVWMRWIGYAIAYATVLPGLCETLHLLEAIWPFRAVSWSKRYPSPLFLRASLAIGGAALLAALFFPRFCFPLVWLGFALLIEPMLYLRTGTSLLHDIEKGEPARDPNGNLIFKYKVKSGQEMTLPMSPDVFKEGPAGRVKRLNGGTRNVAVLGKEPA